MLHYAGLVDRVWSDAYEITMHGMRYLEGELDACHQSTPTVDQVLQGRDPATTVDTYFSSIPTNFK